MAKDDPSVENNATLPDLDFATAVVVVEDSQATHYLWEVAAEDAWESEVIVESKALHRFRHYVEAKIEPKPVELLRKQRDIFLNAFGKDSAIIKSIDGVMAGKIGQIRKINRLESALLARHAEMNPLDNSDMKKQSEFGAMVYRRDDKLRIYLSIPKPPLPMGAPPVALADRHLKDGKLAGWKLVSHIHNHPFFFGNKYGDIAGTTVPSGPDITTYENLLKYQNVQKPVITNGFHSLEMTRKDIAALAKMK